MIDKSLFADLSEAERARVIMKMDATWAFLLINGRMLILSKITPENPTRRTETSRATG